MSRLQRRMHLDQVLDPAAVDPGQRLVESALRGKTARKIRTELRRGVLEPGMALTVKGEMNTGGTVFGDGIEEDRLALPWGEVVSISRSEAVFSLVA